MNAYQRKINRKARAIYHPAHLRKEPFLTRFVNKFLNNEWFCMFACLILSFALGTSIALSLSL
jgi:hypothetical protein